MNEANRQRDCIIYCIKSNFYGKVYVGSTTHFAKRIVEHICDLRHGRHGSKELQKTFDELGITDLSFSVLELDVPYSERYSRENFWIDFFQSDNPEHGYNTYCVRENPNITFYRNVNRICRSNGITIWKLADALGISHSSPFYWRNGRVPNTKTVKKIADYLDVSIEELLK